MLYLHTKGETKPIVDIMMEEVALLNYHKAQLRIMIDKKKFNRQYTETGELIESAEWRIENYKRMLAAHNETVGNNGDTYLKKVAGI